MATVYELSAPSAELTSFDPGPIDEFPYDELAEKIEVLYFAIRSRDVPKDWHKDLVLLFAPYL